MPFFDTLNFFSRKFIDFKYWSIGLKLHKLGYFNILESKLLIIKIANSSIYNTWYSTNIYTFSILPNENEISKIFSLPTPFDLSLEKSHTELSQEYARNKSSRQGF